MVTACSCAACVLSIFSVRTGQTQKHVTKPDADPTCYLQVFVGQLALPLYVSADFKSMTIATNVLFLIPAVVMMVAK